MNSYSHNILMRGFMMLEVERMGVLFSFPHKLGADKICYTVW